MISPTYQRDYVWTPPVTAAASGHQALTAVAFLHPLGLCLFPFGLSHVGRVWLLGTLAVACYLRGPLFRGDLGARVAAAVAGFFALALCLLPHLDEAAFGTDALRLLSAALYFVLCLVAFRDEFPLPALGAGLATTAGVFLAASLPSLVRALHNHSGSGNLTLYEEKDTLSAVAGFHINPNLPLLLGVLWFTVALLRPRLAGPCFAGLVGLAGSWVLGVRATFFGAAAALVIFASVRFRPSLRHFWPLAVVTLLLLPVVTAALSAQQVIDGPWFFDLDKALSGRLTLWTAGWQTFLAHPWGGAGPESWQTQLAIHLPSTFEWREQSSLALESGGFHSALIQLLAERGAPLALLFLVASWAIARSAVRILARPADPSALVATPFAYLSLMFICRSLFEVSGFLGPYKGPVDYFCTLLFAITLIRGGER